MTNYSITKSRKEQGLFYMQFIYNGRRIEFVEML